MSDKVKFCGRCKSTLPITAFGKNVAKKDGLQERCRKCVSAHYKSTKHKRIKPTKEQKRKYRITHYGLTLEQYTRILETQNNACAICKSSDWQRDSPSIDHCHSTGKVRGLLCNTCNRALGMFKDSAELLEEAAAYVRRS